jgi:hypothetical protein
MKLYYASLNEYIMIWGTPIGSEGHSGSSAMCAAGWVWWQAFPLRQSPPWPVQ